MSKTLRNIILTAIVVISFGMHYRGFSKDLMSIHVWRQALTQTNIINFYEEDMNILNPRRNERGTADGIYRLEFPLMQWLVACLYKGFGNHLVITRIFMFITGLFSILGLYKLLLALFHDITPAVIGAWAFNFSPSFFYYTINPLPDNFALCTGIWGLALFFTWLNNKKGTTLLFSGIFLSIGTLCKLPFIIYYTVPFIYFIRMLLKNGISKKIFFQAFTVCGFIMLPLAWYSWVIPAWSGNPTVMGMADNQSSAGKIFDYLQHNLISNLPELLLNYGSLLFFLAGFYFLKKYRAFKDSRFPLIFALSIMALAYYFFEINTIGKVHDYYLFPFYPLLFMLVAYGAYHLYYSKIRFLRILTIALLLLLPVTCHLRMQKRWDPDSPGLNKDLLRYKTELQNAVPRNALVVVGNDPTHAVFLYYINKKGWSFQDDSLPVTRLEQLAAAGAQYLYTDSEKIDFNSGYDCCIGKLVAEKGSIRVFSLRNSNP